MAKVYEVAFKINGMLSGQFAEAMRQAKSQIQGLSAAAKAVNASMGATLQGLTNTQRQLNKILADSQKYAQKSAATSETKANLRAQVKLTGDAAQALRNQRAQIESLKSAYDRLNAATQNAANAYLREKANLDALKAAQSKQAAQIKSNLGANLRDIQNSAKAQAKLQLDNLKRAQDAVRAQAKLKLDELKKTQAAQEKQIKGDVGKRLKTLQDAVRAQAKLKLDGLKNISAGQNKKVDGKNLKALQDAVRIQAKLKLDELKKTQAAQEKQIKGDVGKRLKALQDAVRAQAKLKLDGLGKDQKKESAQIKSQLGKNLKALESAAKRQEKFQLGELKKYRAAQEAQIKSQRDKNLKALQDAAKRQGKIRLEDVKAQKAQEKQISSQRDKNLKALENAAKRQEKSRLDGLKRENAEKATQIKRDLEQRLKALQDVYNTQSKMQRGNLKAAQNAAKRLAQAELGALKGSMTNQISSLNSAKAQFDALKASLKGASAELKTAESALKNLGNNFNASKSKVNELYQALQRQKQELASLKASLSAAGFSTDHFLQSELKLKEAIAATTREIERQRQIAASLTAAQERVNNAQSNFGDAQSVFSAVTNAAETVAAPFVEATQNAITFEKELSKLKALSQMRNIRAGNFDAVKNEMAELQAQAELLGATTEFTATEVVQAMNKYAMAGWNKEQISAAMQSTVDAASIAGDHNMLRTADVLSDDMMAFGIKAGQAYKLAGGKVVDGAKYFTDAFAYAWTNANLDRESLHEAWKYNAPSAQAAGLSLGEALAQNMLIANAGIKNSMAGTSFRAGWVRFLAPPKTAKKSLEEMGAAASDATKQLMEAQDALKEAGTSVEEGLFEKITKAYNYYQTLGKNEKAGWLKALVGQTALSGWMKAFDEGGIPEIIRIAKEIDSGWVEGWASDTATIMRDNTATSIEYLKSAFDALQRSVGDAFLSAVDSAAKVVTPYIASMAQWAKENPRIIQGVAAITAAVMGLTIAISGAVLAFMGWEFLTAQLALFRAGMVATEVASMGLAARMGSAFAVLQAQIMGLTFSGILASVTNGIKTLGAAFMTAARASLAFIATPLGAALTALALAAYIVYQNWDRLAPVFGQIGGAISDALSAAGDSIGNLLNALGSLGNHLLNFFGKIFEGLKLEGFTDGIIAAILGIVDVIAGLGVSIVNVFTAVVNTLADVTKGLGDVFSDVWDGNFIMGGLRAKKMVADIKAEWSNMDILKGDFGYDIMGNFRKHYAAYKNPPVQAPQPAPQIPAVTPPAATSTPETSAPTIDATQAQAGLDTAGQAATQAGTALQNIPQAVEPLNNFSTAIEPAQTALQNFPATLEPTQTALQGIVDVAGAARDNIQQLGDKAGGAYASVEQLGTAAGGAYGNVELLGGAAGGAKGQVSGMGLAADAVAGALQTAASRIANIQITAPTISATPVTPAGLYTGGIYDKGAFLTWFAERSPEAAIPLDKSARAVKLWTQAGQMLGVLPSDGATPKIDKPSTESKRGNILTLQRQVENRVNQIYNSAQKVTETGRVVPYNPLPEEVQERSKIPPAVLTERQRYTSKDVTKESTLERVRNSRSYQALFKAQGRVNKNSTSILNKPEQFDIPTDFLKIGGFDLGKIPFIGKIVGKFEDWLTKITGMQPVDVYNKFINRKKPQLDATKIFTQTMPRRRGLDNTLQTPPNVMPNLPLSRGKILNPTTTFPSLEPQALTERLSNFEPLESVTPSMSSNNYSPASFQPTININVTVHTDGSPSSIREVGEKIAYSARESFEKMWDNFMREKSRRSFA